MIRYVTRNRTKTQEVKNSDLSIDHSNSTLFGSYLKTMVENKAATNALMLKKLLIFTVMMFLFGYALVPFYEKFCEVTGINNLLQPDKQSKEIQVDKSRWITIEFDANIQGLPWEFKSMQSSARIHPGEPVTVMYEITNMSDREISAQAIPSYSPRFLDKYLKKFECFCFTKQVLKPKETKQMPVQFVIEPSLPAELQTMTISYTFFELPANSSVIKK